jgi:hypothetical protein
MKRFIQKTILFSGVFCGANILIILILILQPYANKDNALLVFFQKQELLNEKRRTQTPSIILLGGSNVVFGFNSEVLEDSLKIPVINAGLTATLGLKFMIDDISKHLDAGDKLVLVPEYEHFFNETAYGGIELERLFCMYPSICKDFNMQQYKVVIDNVLTTLQRKFKANLPSKKTKQQALPGLSKYNKYGDYTAHWGLANRPYKRGSIIDSDKLNISFIDYYGNSIRELRDRGIEVILVPPPLAEHSYKISASQLNRLSLELDQRDVDFIVPVTEFVYSDSLFFDSSYHLNYSGVTIRTSRVLEIIRSCN